MHLFVFFECASKSDLRDDHNKGRADFVDIGEAEALMHKYPEIVAVVENSALKRRNVLESKIRILFWW